MTIAEEVEAAFPVFRERGVDENVGSDAAMQLLANDGEEHAGAAVSDEHEPATVELLVQLSQHLAGVPLPIGWPRAQRAGEDRYHSLFSSPFELSSDRFPGKRPDQRAVDKNEEQIAHPDDP
jgi:hypothetical protein